MDGWVQLEQGTPGTGVEVGTGSPCDLQPFLPPVWHSGVTAQASADGAGEALWLPSERVRAYGELARGCR